MIKKNLKTIQRINRNEKTLRRIKIS